MHRGSWFAIGMATLSLAGCGGAQQQDWTAAPEPAVAPAPAAPVRARGQERVAAEVGVAGAVLELNDGARLEIPPNALSEATLVTFQLGQRTTVFSNKDYESPIGPALAMSPAIASPEAAHVTLSMPVGNLPQGFNAQDARVAIEAEDDTQRVFGENSTVTRWHYQRAEVRNGRIIAEMEYVPGLRVQFLVSRDD